MKIGFLISFIFIVTTIEASSLKNGKVHSHHHHHKSRKIENESSEKNSKHNSRKPDDKKLSKLQDDEPLLLFSSNKYCNTYYACSESSETCDVRRCPQHHIWVAKSKRDGHCVNNPTELLKCIEEYKKNQDKVHAFECPTIPGTKWFIDGYFGDDSDCDAFYQCVGGRKYAYLCPRGMSWNMITGMCSASEKSPCSLDLGSGDLGSGEMDQSHSLEEGSGNNDYLTKQNSKKIAMKNKKLPKQSWGYTGRRSRRDVDTVSLTIDLNRNGIIHEEMLLPLKVKK